MKQTRKRPVTHHYPILQDWVQDWVTIHMPHLMEYGEPFFYLPTVYTKASGQEVVPANWPHTGTKYWSTGWE